MYLCMKSVAQECGTIAWITLGHHGKREGSSETCWCACSHLNDLHKASGYDRWEGCAGGSRVQMGDKWKEKNVIKCFTTCRQNSFSAPRHRLEKSLNSTGGMGAIFPKDILSFCVFNDVVESAPRQLSSIRLRSCDCGTSGCLWLHFQWIKHKADVTDPH